MTPEEDQNELKPCPCCGSAAAFQTSDGELAGGLFIECENKSCGITTRLMFPVMDDPNPLLAEIWNSRVSDERQDPADTAASALDEVEARARVLSMMRRDPASRDGVDEIRMEREKQRAKWGDKHDDGHTHHELIYESMNLLGSVALSPSDESVKDHWGLIASHDDPRDRLKIAGALIAAELDRRRRAAPQGDTAASALADVQAIREQRREPQVLQGRVADLEEEASEQASNIELCAKGLQELRERVAALEGK